MNSGTTYDIFIDRGAATHTYDIFIDRGAATHIALWTLGTWCRDWGVAFGGWGLAREGGMERAWKREWKGVEGRSLEVYLLM